MKLRSLRLQNFRQHEDTEIEFPDGVTAIVGRNGSGKSSILEALGMALYGVPATRTNKDLIRRDTAAPGDSVRVELETEVAGQAWSIVRTLRGKQLTPQASLVIDGQTIVPAQAGSNEAVTQEVVRRIGLDRDAFFTTVFSGQKELSRLADQNPATRKKLILGLLGIDAIDDAIQAGRKQRSAAEVRLHAMQLNLPSEEEAANQLVVARAALDAATKAHTDAAAEWELAQATLVTADVELEAQRQAMQRFAELHQARVLAQRDHAAATAAATASETRSKAVAAARTEAENLAGADDALATARQQFGAAQARDEAQAAYDHAQREIARMATPAPALVPPDEQTVATARQRAIALEAKLQQLQVHLAEVRAKTAHAQAQHDKLHGVQGEPDCPVCQRPLEGHLPALLNRMSADIEAGRQAAHEATTRRNAGAKAHAEATQTVNDLDRRYAEAQATAKAQARDREHAAILAKTPQPPAALEPLQSVRERVAAAETRASLLTAARARAERFEALVAEAERAKATLLQAQASLDQALAALACGGRPPDIARAAEAHQRLQLTERAAERQVSQTQGAVGLATATVTHQETRVAELKERHQRVKEAQVDLQHWELVVGARGGGLMDRFRDHMVGRIGPAVAAEASELLARFSGGRYTEIMLDEGYQIYVADGGVPYELARYSGGESDLVHLALRLAVSRLLLERGDGAEIRFLALDEVFGSLDEERKDLVLAALQQLGGLYSQVLVVTHHNSLRDALDNTMSVEATDGVSTVRMHND